MNVRELAPIILVLAVLLVGAGAAIDGPSHFASSGVTYETNDGLTVTLGDDRDIEASPFADDQTWTSEGVEIAASGDGAALVSDGTFDGETMVVEQIDATTTPIEMRRGDLDNDVTVDGGTTAIIIHDIELDDGETDLEVVASSDTSITIDNLPDVDGIQAVDADGNAVAGDTDTTDGTATLDLDAGEYELRLQDGPSTLTVRDLFTDEIITEDEEGNDIDVELEFFGDDGSVESRTTSDGVIDMTGLPADERFSVSVDAGDGYVQRQIIIPSLLEQQNAFLLPADADIDTVEPRFELEDPSGQFDVERSEIVLERPIDRGEGTEFVAVTGDRVGLNGFDAILERDQRYRVTVTDPDTQVRRVLGEFTPTQSEPVTLTVEDIEFDSIGDDIEGVEWTARYLENEDDLDEVQFIYRSDFETVSLDVTISERGNEENVLVSESAAGNVTITEPVPEADEGAVWVVEWEAETADGDTISSTRPVSSDTLPVGPEIPDHWQTVFSIFALFVVGGLFGSVNPGVGGIAVAGTGGVLFLIGWLPDSTGGLMVAVALMIGVLAYVGRRARGATA